MANDDERDYAEEAHNKALLHDEVDIEALARRLAESLEHMVAWANKAQMYGGAALVFAEHRLQARAALGEWLNYTAERSNIVEPSALLDGSTEGF